MSLFRKGKKGNKGKNAAQLPRTKYLKHVLYLTLEEMFNGTIRKLAVNKNVLCTACKGRGMLRRRITVTINTCNECHGLGVHSPPRRTSPYSEEKIERECCYCCGKGERFTDKKRCWKCLGRKVVAAQCVLNVKVRQGTRHGQKIIYKDEGTQEPNMRPGDVVVILEAIDHHKFQRQGDDLIMTMPLDLVEALCGFKKVLTTLDKRKLCIYNRRGEVMQNNEIKCVDGEGMPKYANPNERGKLIIQFQVNLPDRIRSRYVTSLEECLPPRQKLDIPIDAVECNLVDMAPADDVYYEQNDEYYIPDQSYDQEYTIFNTRPVNEHEDGTHQYDEQGPYYQDDEYAIPENYEYASDYEQHYYHSHQMYDSQTSNLQQEQFYQQDNDCESLESYDATQQHRFNY